MDAQTKKILENNAFDSEKTDYSAYLVKIAGEFPNTRSIYMCDKYGYEIGHTISIKTAYIDSDYYEKSAIYQNKNWAWRRYFHDILKAIAVGRKSSLSKIYYDFATKDKVRTYSYAITDEVFLFVDIEA